MTVIKKMKVVGPGISVAGIMFALRCMAIGAVIFMAWEICQGRA